MEKGEISSTAFFDQLMEVCDHKIEREVLEELYTDIFRPNPWLLDLELLEKLKKRYRVCLLSNTCDVHIQNLKTGNEDFFAIFDETVLSYECGARKPDAQAYEKFSFNQDWSRCLYLDDREENLEVPRAWGASVHQVLGTQKSRQILLDLSS